MGLIMAVMIVAMLSLGHGPLGASKHDREKPEQGHGHPEPHANCAPPAAAETPAGSRE